MKKNGRLHNPKIYGVYKIKYALKNGQQLGSKKKKKLG